MRSIHSTALEVFGLKDRLAKLRRELIEAANAVDRLEESKGTVDDVVAEMRDVLYVWQSVMVSKEVRGAKNRISWHDHETSSETKLRQAIMDKLGGSHDA